MSLRKLLLIHLVAIPILSAGCYTEEVRPAPPPCHSFWVRGHYDRAGYWHPGHWVCR